MQEFDPNEMEDLLGLPAEKKIRKPYKRKPKVELATTFLAAMQQCELNEQQFIRHTLAGKDVHTAYALAGHKKLSRKHAGVGGRTWLKKPTIANALELAKAEGGIAAISDIKFDVKASFDELGRVLDQAMAFNQLTAAARAAELRAKLFKLLDSNVAQQAQAVTFVFKRFNEAEPQVIESQVVEVPNE